MLLKDKNTIKIIFSFNKKILNYPTQYFLNSIIHWYTHSAIFIKSVSYNLFIEFPRTIRSFRGYIVRNFYFPNVYKN